MFIRNTKDIIQMLLLVLIGYLYRLCLAPFSTLKHWTRHPVWMGFLFLFLFPFYLFIRSVLYLSALFISRVPEVPAEEVQKWSERCSICFEARLDLCLDYCRDQFCLVCFQTYVSETVKSSWGLCVTKIRCPVCRLHIPQAEWTRYVPASVVELYERFNAPYQSYAKCCPQCELEAIPCPFEPKNQHNLSYSISTMIAPLLQHHSLWTKAFEKEEWNNANLFDLHHQLMLALTPRVPEQAKLISQRILGLDMMPDTWRRIQFDHIRFFPEHRCLACQTVFCLQCGDRMHPDKTCEEYMTYLVQSKRDLHHVLTWALEHSQRCPSCSIMINRDEGCNKVDCAFCGFTFCWECKSAWSEKCGFFECVHSQKKKISYRSPIQKTELGVPNVETLDFA
ncbi:hypothetical protein BY458DRAFT_525040 [Sporodiniella umbellata]|nr:hypothetical protein BY458DRAFT_525040 [Sporodiniella umbellata]